MNKRFYFYKDVTGNAKFTAIDTDEIVESIARMGEDQRKRFVRTMVKKWPDLAISISNKIDQEIYDVKNYG